MIETSSLTSPTTAALHWCDIYCESFQLLIIDSSEYKDAAYLNYIMLAIFF